MEKFIYLFWEDSPFGQVFWQEFFGYWIPISEKKTAFVVFHVFFFWGGGVKNPSPSTKIEPVKFFEADRIAFRCTCGGLPVAVFK